MVQRSQRSTKRKSLSSFASRKSKKISLWAATGSRGFQREIRRNVGTNFEVRLTRGFVAL